MANPVEENNPVLSQVAEKGTQSLVAVAGHPIHAMMVAFPIALTMATLGSDVFFWWSGDPFWARASLWACGAAFWLGVAAGLAGTAELLFVPGIRNRAASWTHAVAAMMLLSILGMNWGLRLYADESVILPLGIALSGLSAVFVGIAGWHGGKLVFDHGIGLMISSNG
ncbi:DUF2231 domain-containing protein [Skermanella sp. TT6]|uniref:DUF2231 domain-containing protein n=1 Tax=Skermanella cutis TaxID=2775420 RepID=A0ABX7B0X9_9PROT|nr:DUF2231 domain-containing protein [Skermanella sp. TT6]QQP87772.1 DUF2231 domain-containing protein [Skermanella sp. TT6]